MSNIKKYNIEYFKNLASNNGGSCLSDVYKNGKTKLEFSCKNGHVWFAEPRHIVEGRWCAKCGWQNGRRYIVNHEFFSKDTEESFYIAGFLAADGWKTRASGGYTIGLMLAEKDKDHLIKIKNLMNCNSPIHTRHQIRKICNNKNESETWSNYFIINSEQMYRDLEKFGVVENKTYKLRISDWLANHDFVNHFMRGYIDGDGCYSKSNNVVKFDLCGTKEFLEKFHYILVKNNVCETEREIIANAGSKWLAFGNLNYGGNRILSKLYRFLYHSATVFLVRKEEVIKQATELEVYNTNRKRKARNGSLMLTKDILLSKAKELKSGTNVARYFNCSAANISWWIRYLNIKSEWSDAIGKLDYTLVCDSVKNIGSLETAKKFKISRARVYQIINNMK